MAPPLNPPYAGPVSAKALLTALERGVLTREQLDALLLLEMEAIQSEPQDDEKLRFISGFGDIFVTIGLMLFLGALAYFGASFGGVLGMPIALAITSWVLAEFFTRVRRMALPSIVLLTVFATSLFFSAYYLILTGGEGDLAFSFRRFWQADHPVTFVIASLVTVAGAAAHYWRFRVPITIASGVLALIGAIVGLLFIAAPSFLVENFTPVMLICGLAVFALAMRFDLSDPYRVTRRTDIAFWLHLLAAPLIVHPLVRTLALDSGIPNAGAAWGILAVFAGLAVVAVIVDRRAILVSGLTYAGIAFATLVGGNGIVGVIPLTMLALGALVLLLSAGWQWLRRSLIGLLPAAIAQRLPRSHLRHFQG